MKWKEYDKLNSNVDLDGKRLYICDVRVAPGGNKFIRNLKPTEVIVCSNSNRPISKKRYYYKYYFLEVKAGKTTTKEIVPYDNTCMSDSVNVFDNYEDCVKCYNKQIDGAVEEYKRKIEDLQLTVEKTLKMKMEEK